jgi:hypothetical protein
MARRRLFIVSGFAIITLACGLSALGAVVKHEPNFYQLAQGQSSDTRRKDALACVREFTQMVKDREASVEKWGCKVSEVELNSFFQEMFAQQGEAENLRRFGISSPTVVLDKDEFRIGFRYDTGWFNTVISYRVKVWLVPKEPNVIAVEFLNARAGGLPITSQALMHQLREAALKLDYKVTLYRHEGNTVAVVQLNPNEMHPKSLLTTLQIEREGVTIQGKTLEHALKPLVPKKAAPMPEVNLPK